MRTSIATFMKNSPSSIPAQVRLPAHVAFRVVMQGIRVRLERSLITMMGVALGIAFLMSILAGQIIKEGVSTERAIRQEASRMRNVFLAEAGLPAATVLQVIELGTLNPMEQRLLKLLEDAKLRGLYRDSLPREDVNAILIVGEGRGGESICENLCESVVKNKEIEYSSILLFTSGRAEMKMDANIVSLSRTLTDEEILAQAQEQKKERFRNIWIVTISLLVTLIGITNSMLMSVTERFREIGTMKCLGALSFFVRQMFLIESSLTGLAGAVTGAVAGTLFSVLVFGFTYGFGNVLGSMAYLRLTASIAACVAIGVAMAVIAALYPARFASRMLPAHALRSEI